jgi:hypothetical protein
VAAQPAKSREKDDHAFLEHGPPSRRYNSAMPICAQRTKSETCDSILISDVKTVTGAVDGYKNGYTQDAAQIFSEVKPK